MSNDPQKIPSLKPRHFPPPPPLVSQPKGLWSRTPPAIFPPILGLFGLGLAWRAMAARPGMYPVAPISDVILGATLVLFAFALLAWLSKPLRRPGIILEELAVLPGRAGLAAMMLSFSLAAAALVPIAPAVALGVVSVGLFGLFALGVLIAWQFFTGAPEARVVTPVFHLTYAGYIIAPLALVPLGYFGTSRLILIGACIAAALIWAISLWQLIRRIPPAPLRPLLAIHLAPASLLTTVSALLDYPTLALAFGILAMAILLALLVSARWLLSAGFTPLWGALTFPLAASASAALWGLGAAGLWIGWALLLLSSALIPWIAFQVIKGWAKGDLAAKTNAATV
ncbi:tellurium resistance protein [Pararhodobacter oceanensis]|uniref:Tellurium resistance protein n=1 Tax=Pararhodobacter oceanensis TaxID=2172121 RepID=A0A2T8HTG2_9RHOB|nr:tellurium resistance protein [Pararhodobacter oceanensis]PVH28721.1 tellurium resistance protein [Pararhodobacter oceanensis]